MKKVLFLDRDGTLVIEPPIDFQLDRLEKLEFYPGVFASLSKIVKELDYSLVMVTNQDGLGTNSFPEDTFWPVHNKIIQAFKNEGILFTEVIIDRSLPIDGSSTRKPGLGLMQKYIHGKYDLKNSFVIGDRSTDMDFACNLGCRGIFLGEQNHFAELNTRYWSEIYSYLKDRPRKSSVIRETKETKIHIEINVDGTGQSDIYTGLGFFDHMLDQISKHGNLDLKVLVDGDLDIDEHHTIEDVAITLGQAFDQALGSKKGISRYGFLLPMDDCLAQVAIDFGGRPWIEWQVDFTREKIGDLPTEMFFHFFKSFSDHAKCNLNIKAEGQNEHHKIEAIFKAFAQSIKMAVSKTENFAIPSTKGSL